MDKNYKLFQKLSRPKNLLNPKEKLEQKVESLQNPRSSVPKPGDFHSSILDSQCDDNAETTLTAPQLRS
jgi:hypothetical protein